MRQIIRAGLFALAALASAAPAAQGQVPLEFSADAVRVAPDRGEKKARMYVGKDAVRTEYSRDSQQVVELTFPSAQKRLVLLPQQRVYMEEDGMPGGARQAAMNQPDANPCAGVPDATCKLLGRETVNGRMTAKWELVRQRDGQTQRSLHWLDVERKLALREYFPDGTVSELRLLGRETMNGRQTEKWEMLVTPPEGQTLRSHQWYDPELKITIREEMPGGYVRELRNINIGPQQANLFQVPRGYKQVTPPPAAAAGSQRMPAGPASAFR